MHFTPFKNIKKAAKKIAENQFDAKAMIYKMIEVIPQESHNFRTILPDDFADKCKNIKKINVLLRLIM